MCFLNDFYFYYLITTAGNSNKRKIQHYPVSEIFDNQFTCVRFEENIAGANPSLSISSIAFALICCSCTVSVVPPTRVLSSKQPCSFNFSSAAANKYTVLIPIKCMLIYLLWNYKTSANRSHVYCNHRFF